MARPGAWWITDESPGTFGDREIWVDEAVLDMITRGDAGPAAILRHNGDISVLSRIGAVIRFGGGAGPGMTATYKIASRRWSRANGGRPYYVLERPVQL